MLKKGERGGRESARGGMGWCRGRARIVGGGLDVEIYICSTLLENYVLPKMLGY